MGLLDDAIREHLDLKRRNGADPAEVERLEREALGPVRREPAASSESATSFEEHDDVGFEGHEPAVADFDEPKMPIEEPEESLTTRDDAFDVPDDAAAVVPEDEPVEEPAQPDPEPAPKRRGLLGRLRGDHLEPEAADAPEDFNPLEPEGSLAHPDESVSAPSETEPVDPHATQIYEQPESPAEKSAPRRPDFGSLPGAAAAEPETGPATEVHDVTQHFEDENVHEAVGGRAGGAAEPEAPAEAEPPVKAEAPAETEAPDAEKPDSGAGEDEDLLEETPDFLQDTPDHDRLWFEQRPPKDFDFDG